MVQKGFKVNVEYYFYEDEQGQQKFTTFTSTHLDSKITLRNRIAVLLFLFNLVWRLR